SNLPPGPPAAAGGASVPHHQEVRGTPTLFRTGPGCQGASGLKTAKESLRPLVSPATRVPPSALRVTQRPSPEIASPNVARAVPSLLRATRTRVPERRSRT